MPHHLLHSCFRPPSLLHHPDRSPTTTRSHHLPRPTPCIVRGPRFGDLRLRRHRILPLSRRRSRRGARHVRDVCPPATPARSARQRACRSTHILRSRVIATLFGHCLAAT